MGIVISSLYRDRALAEMVSWKNITENYTIVINIFFSLRNFFDQLEYFFFFENVERSYFSFNKFSQKHVKYIFIIERQIKNFINVYSNKIN